MLVKYIDDKRLSGCGGVVGRARPALAALSATQTHSHSQATDTLVHIAPNNTSRANMTNDTNIKKFTREEVSKYNNKSQAVFIIDNVVYDVSAFLDEHPGGHEVLINEIGKDATEEFDDIGHSLDAKELMKKYVIGELVEEDRIEKQKKSYTFASDSTKDEDSSFISSWKFPVLLGILVTVLYSYLFG